MPQTRFLNELSLHRHYDPASDGCDLIRDFYIPCLSCSNQYNRISAYFSSAVLKSFCPGLHLLFQNQGYIRFIFSCQLDKEDMDSIEQGYQKRMDNLADELEENHGFALNDFEIANLGYLIEHQLADVKIAFMLKDEASICHIKAGTFTDSAGNKVYFEGSGNETINGTMRNAENYTVACNFISNEQALDVQYGEEKFERIWNNTYSDTVRTEFPIGKLFEKLKSLSKGKIFNSQVEFLSTENCVFIDIDENHKSILLGDYTSAKLLRAPMVMKTNFSQNWDDLGNDQYLISALSLHILRDVVIGSLNRFRIHYLLSDAAQEYLKRNDQEFEKRFKLGLAIKEDREKELWVNSFIAFQNVVDAEMEAKLKPQQMRNAFFHYEMVSSADFSVPGTGKTYISYGLYAFLTAAASGKKCDHLVVFGPLNCFNAWKEEGNKIFGSKRHLSFFDITEHHADYAKVLQQQKFDVYLFNYEFLGLNNDKTLEKLALLSEEALNAKAMLVFDEIHKLKSLTGTTAANFIRMINDCKQRPIYRLALTGTPLPNSFVDILNYLKLLYTDDMESAFADFTEARLRNADNNPLLADQMVQKLLPVFVRTTKKDLAVPPPDPDDFDTLGVLPTAEEQQLYELIWKSVENPLLKFIRLIQAASNPALLKRSISFDEIRSLYEDDADDWESSFGKSADTLGLYSDEIKNLADCICIATKTKATLKWIQNLTSQNQKVLVWCLFVDTIDFVKQSLAHLGIQVETISGRNAPEERIRLLNEFKYGKTQVLITNPNTLAESVSLHTACNNAIYLEYGFNLTYMLQSKDRIHRVGLEPEVHTHYYYAVAKNNSMARGSIDEAILDRLKTKNSRMLNVIESGKLAVIGDKTSEIDDIRYILRKGNGYSR